jgi:hypothetical protein
MPKPVYIICSESGSEDKYTGLVSHFRVIEQINLQELPLPQEGKPLVIPAMPLQFTAVWAMAEDDRVNDEYEFRNSVVLPDGKEITVQEGTIFFEENKTRQRFLVVLSRLTVNQPGLFKVESRFRRTGQENWLSQSYEIPVVRNSPPVQGDVGAHSLSGGGAPGEE